MNTVSSRGLPSRKLLGEISPKVASVFLRILQDGFVKLDNEDQAIMHCYRSGFIHAEQSADDITICTLSSPLHSR